MQGVIDPATGNSLANSVHDVTEGVANGAVLLAVLHNFVTTAANTAGGGASADPTAEEEVDTSVAPAPTGDPAVDFATVQLSPVLFSEEHHSTCLVVPFRIKIYYLFSSRWPTTCCRKSLLT